MKYLGILILAIIILITSVVAKMESFVLMVGISTIIIDYIKEENNNLIDKNKKPKFYIAIIILLVISSIIDNKIIKKDIDYAIAESSISGEYKSEEFEEINKEFKNNIINNKVLTSEITTSLGFRKPLEIEEELENTSSYYPNVNEGLLKSILFLDEAFIINITDVNEYYLKCIGVVENKILNFVNSEQGYDVSQLNYNKEVSDLLQEAEKTDVILKKEKTIENYNNLKSLFLKAFELAPCGIISLQLARPYEEVILIYPRETYNDFNKIFENGIFGIKYFIQAISFDYNFSFGDVLYRIAKIYHFLGDIPNLDIVLRAELYQTSCAYFELSIKYEEYEDEYKNYNEYYCAMVNHKLGIISNKDNYFYLNKALEHYNNASNEVLNKQTKNDINFYSVEVCYRICDYITVYGENDKLNSIQYYNDLCENYNDKLY